METLPHIDDYETLAREAFQGQPDAQFDLGECYRFGLYGLSPDESMAKRWYERAAAQGHRSATFLLNNWQNRHKFRLYD